MKINFKKFRWFFLTTAGVFLFTILAGVYTVRAVGTWETGYKVDTGAGPQNIALDSLGTCKKITNTSGKNYFIPTKTAAEWNAFVANKPANVAIEDCISACIIGSSFLPCIISLPPTCTSWTYSGYGACQPGNIQYRTILTSSPAGCTGGSPILSQGCVYVPVTLGACGTSNNLHILSSFWPASDTSNPFYCSYTSLSEFTTPSWPPGYFLGRLESWRCYASDIGSNPTNYVSCSAYRDSLIFTADFPSYWNRTDALTDTHACAGQGGFITRDMHLSPLGYAPFSYTATVSVTQPWISVRNMVQPIDINRKSTTLTGSVLMVNFDIDCLQFPAGTIKSDTANAVANGIPSNSLTITIGR